MTNSSKIVHVDRFANVAYSVVAPRTTVVGASNDVGGPFDDGIRTERTRDRARTNALATFDVLTPENWAAYAALMSA